MPQHLAFFPMIISAGRLSSKQIQNTDPSLLVIDNA
jgi:hypothetical protein